MLEGGKITAHSLSIHCEYRFLMGTSVILLLDRCFVKSGKGRGIVQTTEIIICVPPPYGRGNTKNSSARTLPKAEHCGFPGVFIL